MVKYLSLNEIVKAIKKACSINPYLQNLGNAVISTDGDGVISHIWLHNHSCSHRAAYVQHRERGCAWDGSYDLIHYMYKDGRGWVKVGTLKAISLTNVRPKTL